MKLLTKTTLYIATLSLFLFFIMGVIFFQVLKNLSLADLNHELYSLREVVDSYLASDPEYPFLRIAGLDSISIERSIEPGPWEEVLGDTLMYDAASNQYRTYRFLSYGIDQGSGPFRVKVFKSTTPTDQLVERVTLMMTVMVILFLAGVFLLNRTVFSNLWQDFFRTLERLKEFDTSKEPVVFGYQDIEEFAELNKVLEKMTGQLSKDYKELKEYTEHTTHELQTPLAVIKSKTELLIQSKHLGPEEMKLIQAINSSTNQLSRLNSTLTLITRIENRQFPEVRKIDVGILLERHLEMLEELMELRGLRLTKDFSRGFPTMKMDEGLADILVANLLKNAIVHNVEGGEIILETAARSLIISNDGDPLPIPEEDIFNRFTRNQASGSGFGLGLSLVKKICEFYAFSLDYSYADGKHRFMISI